mgnify:CR=1 FL=1
MLMKHIILGTAGHIDHGKTSLIRALTGIDTDRLPEEKSRGITIELGFAHLIPSPDLQISLVDVPGHEKFLHHMIAGVGGIDFVVLVIAADEGIMPQTREHLDICSILGVQSGLIALTKIDLVDEEWRDLVYEDIRAAMQPTFLKDAPIIPVSVQTGQGIESLRRQLVDHASSLPPRSCDGIFRLPVDRVFTIRGFGTVVTGTVTSGQLSIQSPAVLMPGGPSTRIRGLQVHGKPVDVIRAGQRAAINLQNVDKEAITRGMVLSLPDQLPATRVLNTQCLLLNSISRPLHNRQRIRMYVGTAEVLGKAILLDREELRGQDSGFIQFRLEEAITCLPGDRFLIRDYSPMDTLGGGVILDPESRISKRYNPVVIENLRALHAGTAPEKLLAMTASTGLAGLPIHHFSRRFPQDTDHFRSLVADLLRDGRIIEIEGQGGRIIRHDIWDLFRNSLVDAVTRFHQSNPIRKGITREELRTSLVPSPPPELLQKAIQTLVAENRLHEENMSIRLPSHVIQMTTQQQEQSIYVENRIRQAWFEGTEFDTLLAELKTDRAALTKLFNFLIDHHTIVRLPGGLVFHREAIDALRDLIIATISDEQSLSVGRFRDAAGISRKQAVPLLEYFDSIGLTRRMQDVRVLRSVS